jgi:hypothetical protein
MTTLGSHIASTTLNELLLDPTKEYVCRITELNAPVNTLPLFGFNAAEGHIDEELFRVKVRNAGDNLVAFNAGNETVNAPFNFSSSLTTIGAGGRVYFTPSSFLTEMGRHSNNITQGIDAIGTAGMVNGVAAGKKHEYFNLRINADGCAEFVGSSVFWNNFCIQFSELGKVIFGVQPFVEANNILSVNTYAADDTLSYNIFDETAVVIDFATHADYVVAVDTVKIVGRYPLFKHLDHRYLVSVETDLLVQQSIKVVDGKQSVDRSICKVFFPSDIKVNLQSEGGVMKEDVDIQLKTRVGQHAFVKKTNPSAHWVSLQTSYDVRYFRFYLYVTYKVFDAATQKYRFNRKKYPISQDDSWDISIEFVSKL